MDFDPFDKNVAVPLVAPPKDFDDLADSWRTGEDEHRRAAARHLESAVHAADVQRAAGPVVFSAAMGDAGTVVAVPAAGLVTWSPSVPGSVGASTVPQSAALCTSGCAWSMSPGSR